MAMHSMPSLPLPDDEFLDPPAVAPRGPALPRRLRREVTEDALTWAALVLLTLGPMIGYLLAALL